MEDLLNLILAGGSIVGLLFACVAVILSILYILAPLMIFFQYGELKRVRRASEKMEKDLYKVGQSVGRIEDKELRQLAEQLGRLERMAPLPVEKAPEKLNPPSSITQTHEAEEFSGLAPNEPDVGE